MICTAPTTKHRPAHVNWSPGVTDVSHVRVLVADDEPHLVRKRSGLEVLQDLRADGNIVCPKVIMLSARAYAADIELGVALGADGYITKPFSPRELVACVRAHLATC